MTFTTEVVSDAQARYTGLMNEKWKQGAQELIANPLAWASYAAWLAVWLSVSAVYGRPDAGFPALADALLFVWLLCWMICLLDELTPPRIHDIAIVALTGMTAVVLWFLPAGTTPILLILLAAQFTNRLPAPWLALALLAVNLYFAPSCSASGERAPRALF